MSDDDLIRQFRKKPVVIEAVQWTGDNLNAVMTFCAGDATYELMAKGNAELVIGTLEDGAEFEARHVASRGDWIIKGVKGEFYPCKPDIFDATYEDAALPADPQIAKLQAERARLVETLQGLADEPTIDEMPGGEFSSDRAEWHRGYDAAVRHARALLAELGETK